MRFRERAGIDQMIEIIGLQSESGEKHSWRVTWPEPDGAKGSSDYESCELAVEFALLIRVLMHIQQGQRYLVVVSDDDSGTGHDKPISTNLDRLKKSAHDRKTVGTETADQSYSHA
jgi:hypothetical protein